MKVIAALKARLTKTDDFQEIIATQATQAKAIDLALTHALQVSREERARDTYRALLEAAQADGDTEGALVFAAKAATAQAAVTMLQQA